MCDPDDPADSCIESLDADLFALYTSFVHATTDLCIEAQAREFSESSLRAVDSLYMATVDVAAQQQNLYEQNAAKSRELQESSDLIYEASLAISENLEDIAQQEVDRFRVTTSYGEKLLQQQTKSLFKHDVLMASHVKLHNTSRRLLDAQRLSLENQEHMTSGLDMLRAGQQEHVEGLREALSMSAELKTGQTAIKVLQEGLHESLMSESAWLSSQLERSLSLEQEIMAAQSHSREDLEAILAHQQGLRSQLDAASAELSGLRTEQQHAFEAAAKTITELSERSEQAAAVLGDSLDKILELVNHLMVLDFRVLSETFFRRSILYYCAAWLAVRLLTCTAQSRPARWPLYLMFAANFIFERSNAVPNTIEWFTGGVVFVDEWVPGVLYFVRVIVAMVAFVVFFRMTSAGPSPQEQQRQQLIFQSHMMHPPSGQALDPHCYAPSYYNARNTYNVTANDTRLLRSRAVKASLAERDRSFVRVSDFSSLFAL